jgi:predicted nucleotidyltransferase
MTRAEALRRLREREPDLRKMGIARLSLFGSTARDEQRPDSDVDLAAVLAPDHAMGLLEFVGIQLQLAKLLGAEVDLVTEPARKARLQMEIDRDRVIVFS